MNVIQRKAGVAVEISDKAVSQSKKIARDKKKHYKIIKM